MQFKLLSSYLYEQLELMVMQIIITEPVTVPKVILTMEPWNVLRGKAATYGRNVLLAMQIMPLYVLWLILVTSQLIMTSHHHDI